MASRFWVRHNEDARAAQHRAAYVAENGGEWVHRGGTRGWHHTAGESVVVAAPAPVSVKKSSVKKK